MILEGLLRRRRSATPVAITPTSVICYLALVTITSQLDIRRPPSITQFPIDRKIYNDDSILQLDCVAEGSPKPEYSWYKNGATLSGYGANIHQVDEGSITIKLTQFDAGYYQCFATNMYGMALSNMVLLERAVLAHYPAGRNINDLGTINEGEPLMMPCEKTKYYPKPTFSWAIVNGLDDPTETPVVLDKRIQMDDSGNLYFSYLLTGDTLDGKLYKCKLFNPVRDMTIGGSYTKLVVKSIGGVLPFGVSERFSSNSTLLGLEGRDVSLRCFFSGNPEPTIEWKKQRGSLPIRRTQYPNQYKTELMLLNLTPEDAGTYECVGSNYQDSATVSMVLTVEAIPVFRSTEDYPCDVNATDGDTVNIYCKAYAVPRAIVVWMKNGVPLNSLALPRNFRISEDGVKLTIINLRKDYEDGTTDLMVIQCNASNVHGSAFAAGYINVLKRTVINVLPDDITLESNSEHAEFSFIAESDDSTPIRMEWFRVWSENSLELMQNMGDVVRVDDHGKLQFNLPVNSTVRTSYNGNYMAVASTPYSRETASITFMAKELEYVPEPTAEGVFIAAASLFDNWWIIVIIVVVLLLLILLLCCCLCIQRNKGETYPVYNEERKSKNDPDKDIEDSGFHEYSRPESRPVFTNSASLLNGLGKLNDDSENDDISLDYGYEDHGKYTEDGSFIGDYVEDNR